MKNEDLGNEKRLQLVNEFLLTHGVTSLEDAPDELINAARKEADAILGNLDEDEDVDRPEDEDPDADDPDFGSDQVRREL